MGSKKFKHNRKERRAEHFDENSETWQKMQKDFEEHMKKWEMKYPPDESEDKSKDEDDPFQFGEDFADFCEMLYAFPYGSEYWGKKLLDKYFYGEEVIEETP